MCNVPLQVIEILPHIEMLCLEPNNVIFYLVQLLQQSSLWHWLVSARLVGMLHAISGCDTTSALFGHGKSSVFIEVVGKPDTSTYKYVVFLRGNTERSCEFWPATAVILYVGGQEV